MHSGTLVIVPFLLMGAPPSSAQTRPAPAPVVGSSVHQPTNQPASRSVLRSLNSLDDLRAAFNEHAGTPRVVLLLSPT
jgi:hypothetical protein